MHCVPPIFVLLCQGFSTRDVINARMVINNTKRIYVLQGLLYDGRVAPRSTCIANSPILTHTDRLLCYKISVPVERQHGYLIKLDRFHVHIKFDQFCQILETLLLDRLRLRLLFLYYFFLLFKDFFLRIFIGFSHISKITSFELYNSQI